MKEGRSLTVDLERIARWGGVESLKSRLESETNGEVDGGVIEEFSGELAPRSLGCLCIEAGIRYRCYTRSATFLTADG